jgi:peptidoglycan/LPS O-acetylase OafA/YrhL
MVALRPTRLPGLELLRGLAALAVCAGHVRALLLPPYRQGGGSWWETGLYFLTCHGEAAVWIFFVLSGYLIGGTVLRQRAAGTWNWPGYLLRRGVRLWVVLIPALALTFLCDAWRGDAPIPVGPALPALIDPARSAAATFLGNLFFLQDLCFPTYGSNASLWSLAYEFWFYLLFPLVVACVQARTFPARLGCAAAAIGLLASLGPRGWWLALPWLAGVAVAMLEMSPRPPARAFDRRWPWMALSLALCALAGLPAGARAGGLLLVALASAILVWSEAARPGPLPQPWVQLGVASFTLYAIHLPLAVLATAVLAGPAAPLGGPARWAAAFALTIGLVLFAQAWWWLFERRTERVHSALAARLTLSR